MEYLEYTLYTYTTSQGKAKDVQIAFAAGGGGVCCNYSFPWEFISHFGSSKGTLSLALIHLQMFYQRSCSGWEKFNVAVLCVLSPQDGCSSTPNEVLCNFALPTFKVNLNLSSYVKEMSLILHHTESSPSEVLWFFTSLREMIFSESTTWIYNYNYNLQQLQLL